MKKNIWPLIGALFLELFLLLVFGLLAVISMGYIVSNVIVWTNFSILQFASGWDAFWMFWVFFSDALLYVILVFMFVEIGLYLLRTSGKVIVKGYEKYSGKIQDKWANRFKSMSLLVLFRLIKINTVKRGIIAYVSIIVLMLLSGFIGKTVLTGKNALIYRAFETINLYSHLEEVDFTPSINDDQVFDLLIEGGVANIHLYQVKESSKAKFYLLYDDEQIKDAYEFEIDYINQTITARLNLDQESYTRYVDSVLPSLEFYLPEWLKLDHIRIDIHTAGNVTIDYLKYDSIEIDASKSEIYLRTLSGVTPSLIQINAFESKLNLQVDQVDQLHVSLRSTEANIRIRVVNQEMVLQLIEQSRVFMFQSTIVSLNAVANNSVLELREVYPTQVAIQLTSSTLYYVNGQSTYPYGVFSIEQTLSKVTTQGVPYDSSSE
jgi:hypothetical protein